MNSSIIPVKIWLPENADVFAQSSFGYQPELWEQIQPIYKQISLAQSMQEIVTLMTGDQALTNQRLSQVTLCHHPELVDLINNAATNVASVLQYEICGWDTLDTLRGHQDLISNDADVHEIIRFLWQKLDISEWLNPQSGVLQCITAPDSESLNRLIWFLQARRSAIAASEYVSRKFYSPEGSSGKDMRDPADEVTHQSQLSLDKVALDKSVSGQPHPLLRMTPDNFNLLLWPQNVEKLWGVLDALQNYWRIWKTRLQWMGIYTLDGSIRDYFDPEDIENQLNPEDFLQKYFWTSESSTLFARGQTFYLSDPNLNTVSLHSAQESDLYALALWRQPAAEDARLPLAV